VCAEHVAKRKEDSQENELIGHGNCYSLANNQQQHHDVSDAKNRLQRYAQTTLWFSRAAVCSWNIHVSWWPL